MVRYGIVSRLDLEIAIDKTKEVISLLRDEGKNVVIEKELADKIGDSGVPIEKMNADIVICIGGDGTILRIIRHTTGKILGINAGDIGFLTEVDISNLSNGIKKLLSGKYIVERRIMLRSFVGEKEMPDAVNEVVIHTANISKMRNYEVRVNGEVAQSFRADGIIVATPTGSTCYAMSAGGPILDPRVEAIVITAIAPFKSSLRPMVIPIDSTVKIRLIDDKPSVIVIDGQEEMELKRENVRIERSPRYAEFIRFEINFYKRLLEKLKL